MLVKILKEPKNAILKQYQKLLALDEVKQQRVRFRSASAAKMQEQRDKLDGRTLPQEDGGEE